MAVLLLNYYLSIIIISIIAIIMLIIVTLPLVNLFSITFIIYLFILVQLCNSYLFLVHGGLASVLSGVTLTGPELVSMLLEVLGLQSMLKR